MLKQFDKNVTSQMKTLAFILMLVHHLWKESVLSYLEPVAYEHILLSIGLMGKICVGIFMFLSGYGMMSSAIRGGNMSVIKRLKKVLFPFWLVVLLVAPYLLIRGTVSWTDVVSDSLLLTRNMNGSWWFMQTYVIFVICFPLFAKSLYHAKVWIPLFIASILCFQPVANEIRQYSEDGHYLLFYFPLLYSGMVARKLALFDMLAKKRLWFRLLLIVLLVCVRFGTGWHILNIGLIVSMIMLLVDIQCYLSVKVKNIFYFLGKMSMNMWLIHVFFISYGFHLGDVFIDLAWVYLETLVAAYILYFIKKWVSLRMKYIRKLI